MIEIVKKLDHQKAILKCNRCSSEYEAHFRDAAKSRCGHICNACKNSVAYMYEITQEKLIEEFTYNPETGVVTKNHLSHHFNIGDVMGHLHNQGYLSICIGNKSYLLHRIIWVMQTGEWPEQIDHINHNKTDNRWCNLREVGNRENLMNMSKKKNNSSGYTGIRISPKGKYWPHIMVNRKQIFLGSFDNLEDALEVRKEAEIKYGFHKNHGK